jgi:hypothetical protein
LHLPWAKKYNLFFRPLYINCLFLPKLDKEFWRVFGDLSYKLFYKKGLRDAKISSTKAFFKIALAGYGVSVRASRKSFLARPILLWNAHFEQPSLRAACSHDSPAMNRSSTASRSLRDR